MAPYKQYLTVNVAAQKLVDESTRAFMERGFTPIPELADRFGDRFVEFTHDDGIFMLRRTPVSPETLAASDEPIADKIELRFSPSNPKPDVDALIAMAAALSRMNLPQFARLSLYDNHDERSVEVDVRPGISESLLRIAYDRSLEEYRAFLEDEKEWLDRTLHDFSVLPAFRVEEDEDTRGVHTFKFVFKRGHSAEKLGQVAQRITDTLCACEDPQWLEGGHAYVRMAHDEGEISAESVRAYSNAEIRAEPVIGSDREIHVAVPSKFLNATDVLHKMAVAAQYYGRI